MILSEVWNKLLILFIIKKRSDYKTGKKKLADASCATLQERFSEFRLSNVIPRSKEWSPECYYES